MEIIQSSKKKKENSEKLSLRGYYQSLPNRQAPKQEFLNTLINRCGVTLTTVRNWVLYGMKPNNPEHIKIISVLTGIKEEDLWAD